MSYFSLIFSLALPSFHISFCYFLILKNSMKGVMLLKHLGEHIILELWGCDPKILNSEETMTEMLLKGVEASQSTLLKINMHKFSPQGVTGVAVLAESHISIHTWPEYGYAALDVFTCGDDVKPEDAIPVFEEYLKPKHMDIVNLKRGVTPE